MNFAGLELAAQARLALNSQRPAFFLCLTSAVIKSVLPCLASIKLFIISFFSMPCFVIFYW